MFPKCIVILFVLAISGCAKPTGDVSPFDKYNDTGLKFDTVDQLLEICKAVTPGETKLAEITAKFGPPQNQLAHTNGGRTWVTWRAGEPLVQIILNYDTGSDIVYSASGKYANHNGGQWLWKNYMGLEPRLRCALET